MRLVSRNCPLHKEWLCKIFQILTWKGLQFQDDKNMKKEVHCSLETTTNDRYLFYELLPSQNPGHWSASLYTSFTIIVISIWSLRARIRIRTHSTHRETGRTQQKMAIWKPKREISEETEPATAVILDFQSAGLWESKFLVLKNQSASGYPALKWYNKEVRVGYLYWIIQPGKYLQFLWYIKFCFNMKLNSSGPF